jgi:hypothetical protein
MMNSNEKHEGHDRHEHCMGRGRWIKIPFFILAMILVKSAIVHFLWNDIVPPLFNGPQITFLNAVELIVLAKFLFGFGHGHGPFGGGGFRGRFGRHRHWHPHGHGHPEHRWDGLSSEEREALRQMIRERGER